MDVEGTRKRKKNTLGGPPKKKGKLTLSKVNAKVNRLIRAQDRKYVHFNIKWNESGTFVPFFPSGKTIVLNQIAQGDGGSSRDGNRAFMESLLLRYHVRLIDDKLATYRLMVVWDHSLGGSATPAVSKYLDFDSVPAGEEATAPIKLENAHDFTVLYDDTNGLGKGCSRQVSVAGASINMVTDVTCKHFIKIGKQSVWLDDTTQYPQTGGLVLVTVGNQFTAPTGVPVQNGIIQARVRYTD